MNLNPSSSLYTQSDTQHNAVILSSVLSWSQSYPADETVFQWLQAVESSSLRHFYAHHPFFQIITFFQKQDAGMSLQDEA